MVVFESNTNISAACIRAHGYRVHGYYMHHAAVELVGLYA
jgi:hypothetical protein